MKLIIHDLSTREIERLNISLEAYQIISTDIKATYCQGCFGCWLKVPGKCVYKDKLQYIGALLAQSEEVIIISRNCYGGYSYGIKKILDRSIAGNTPIFTYRRRKIHHACRYKNRPNLTVYLYGDMSALEKQIATELVQANGVNMGCQNIKSFFLEDISELRGRL